jgi:hypothetical protein
MIFESMPLIFRRGFANVLIGFSAEFRISAWLLVLLSVQCSLHETGQVRLSITVADCVRSIRETLKASPHCSGAHLQGVL